MGARPMSACAKVGWSGCLVAVQPRIRLLRSFDERHHTYQGYVLRVEGACGEETGEFLIAIGKGAPPDLTTYRARGHRRLDARTYTAKCSTCMWGCRMPVEIIVDHWQPSNKQYRFETFCYGPKNCAFYRAGPTRKVPGRKGMIWEEEDWVDEDATAHRGPED